MTKEEFTNKFLKEQQRRRKILEYDFMDFKSTLIFKAWKKHRRR